MSTHNNKVVMVGDSNVGKSALAIRFMRDSFSSITDATIGAAFFAKKMDVPGTTDRITMNIWDTSGSERYRALSPMYLRNAQTIILCVSCDQDDPVQNIKENIESYKLFSWDSDIIICITKIDLQHTYDDIKQYAEDMNMKLFETSSKTGSGIQEMFETIAINIHKSSKHEIQVSKPIELTRRIPSPDCCES